MKISIKKVLPPLLIVFFSFLMMVTSPLYHFAYNLTDFNCTMSVAKALAHGQVYFKDIFEQRGIYLYFIHLVGGLMPYYAAKTCIWILEVLNLLGVYWLTLKIGALFNNKKTYYYSTAAILIFILFMPCSNNTADPEEWCLIPIVYSIYLAFKQKFTLKDSWLLGIAMGYVINIKYSLMLIIAGLYFAVGLRMLFQKQFKQFGKTVLSAILGVTTGFIPAIVYFASTNSLDKWLKYYFLDNASSINLTNSVHILLYYVLTMGLFLCFTAWPIVTLIYKINLTQKLNILSQLIWGILGILLIGRAGIGYFLPIIMYLGVLAAIGTPNIDFKAAPKIFKIAMAVVQVFVVCCYAYKSLSYIGFDNGIVRIPNITYYNEARAKRPSYYASRMIDKFGDGKVLTYQTITNDIYMYNNEYPRLFYFDQTTMSYYKYPESLQAQNKYLATSEPKWVEHTTSVERQPNGMSDKELAHQEAIYAKRQRKSNTYSLAEVTAGIEWKEHAMDQFIKYPTQPVKLKDGTYYVRFTLPKVLVKNYKLVYLGMAGHDKSIEGSMQMLWVRNNELNKYPSLKKYVINPNDINANLNSYNSYNY